MSARSVREDKSGRNGADERSLLENELRALKDTIVDGLIIIDANKKVTSFNPGASRIFGYSAAEVVGRNVKMLMPEPYQGEHDAYVDNYRRSGEAKIIGIGREVLGRRKDASTFPMYLSVGEMGSGPNRQFVGVVRDLSEIKDTLEIIQGIAANLPGPVFRRMQDTDGSISFSYVSDGARRAFDLDPAQIMADPQYLRNAIHESDRDGWLKALALSAEDLQPYSYDMRITGENGETKWMRAIAHPHVDPSGKILWDGLALDVTDQKAAESERDETALRWEELLRAVPDAIWIVVDTRIVYANPATATLLGAKDASDLIGLDNLVFIHPDDKEAVLRRRESLKRGGRTEDAIFRRVRLDGITIETENSGLGIHWQGQPANLIIARDVTEKRKAEAQLRQSQKMEAIGQLTGGVAHDFNNLLAVLTMDLEELNGFCEGNEDAEAVLREARDVVQSAVDLTSRLLTFSRQQELEARQIDIREPIGECVSLLRRTIGEQIELHVVEPADLWPVTADPRQLENALLNLAVNARDAMPSGGAITIEAGNVFVDSDGVSTRDELPPGEYVAISVSDTGTGIPQDILEKVFDPFFSTKDVGSGTGLGLSMVYGFAKQSGGHASISSDGIHGTTVRLYFPRATSEQEFVPGEDRVPAIADAPSGRETILLVEDFPQLRKRGAQFLAGLGYDVIQAEHGRDGIDKLEAAPHVDLLFTDIVMPGGMNGFELAELARKHQPDIKVLFTSGYSEGAELDLGVSQADVPRLLKPYSRRDLTDIIRRVLDEH